MATSSITHNFVISDPEAAERFANALDEAEKNRVDLKPSSNVEFLTNPEDILALLGRRKKEQMDNKYKAINIRDLLDENSKSAYRRG